MAGRLLLNRRSHSLLDGQRNEFEKVQAVHFNKAINLTEAPSKIKHVRALIIGTHTAKGAHVYWSLCERIFASLQSNEIIVWKFCYVLHKILREGHSQAIIDSMKHVNQLNSLISSWSNMSDPHAPMILSYLKLLVCKLKFHTNYVQIPGNIVMTEEKLEQCCENDANKCFELAVDFLDYLEVIVLMQVRVFAFLDSLKLSSMTRSGQFCLAPLISCIQDSIELYNLTIITFFKLHSSLSTDMLIGHRQRFSRIFIALKEFYNRSVNLHYFKSLIQIPQLPESAPNFFKASQQNMCQVPAAVLLPDEEDETDTGSTSDILLSTLCDTSELACAAEAHSIGCRQNNCVSTDTNGGPVSASFAELKSDAANNYANSSGQREVQILHEELVLLQQQLKNLNEQEQEMKVERMASERHVMQVEQEGAEANSKYQKMKVVYQKLREEHIQLIREKALADRKLATMVPQDKFDDLANELKAKSSDYEDEIKRQKLEMFDIKEKLQKAQIQLDEYHSDQYKNITSGINANLIKSVLKVIFYTKDEISHILLDTSLKCSKEYFISVCDGCLEALHHLLSPTQREQMTCDTLDQSSEFASSDDLFAFSHLISLCALYAVACNDMTIDYLRVDCVNLLDLFVVWVNSTQLDRSSCVWDERLKAIENKILEMQICIQDFSVNSTRVDDEASCVTEKMLEEEMKAMDVIIEQAAERIQTILTTSLQDECGWKLKVSSTILSACQKLMQAISELVSSSQDLQFEISSIVKSSSSLQNKSEVGNVGCDGERFYRHENRWTLGLISASQAVAVAAKQLVESADKFVSSEEGKFEQIIASTHQVAASSAQLVIASKVKADKNSTKLIALSKCSRNVSTATGELVAAVKTSMNISNSDVKHTQDIEHLSLYETNCLEMESHVRVLELEKSLELERNKLFDLRRQQYRKQPSI